MSGRINVSRICGRRGRFSRLGAAAGWLLLATICTGSDGGAPSATIGPALSADLNGPGVHRPESEDTSYKPSDAGARDLRRLQSEREQRLQGLCTQLEKLARRGRTGSRFASSKPPTTTAAVVETASAPVPASVTSNPLTEVQHTVPLPAAPPTPAPLLDATARVPADPDELAHSDEAAPLEGVIDRVSLADSLYAVGDIATAELVYQAVDVTELNQEQRAWIGFQVAGCKRQNQHFADAQKRYRELVAQGEPPWIAELSRWWLNNLDDRTRLTGNAQRLSALLEQLEQEVDHEIAIDPRLPIRSSPAGAEP